MSGLFSKPKLPPIEPPTPLPDDKQLTAARKKAVASATKGSGYQSTLLAGGGSETLGP